MNDHKKPGASGGSPNNPQSQTSLPTVGIEEAIRAYTKYREANESKEKPYKHISLILTGLSVIAAGLGVALASIGTYLSASQTQVNRQALVAVQRAFVFPLGIEVFPIQVTTQGRELLGFHINWENSGATPTKNLWQFARAETVKADGIASYSMVPPSNIHRVQSVLGPHARLGGSTSRISKTELEKLGTLDGPDLIFFGEAHYEDVFGGEHVTMFCYNIRGWAPLPSSPVLQSNYQQCSRHNCADDECKTAQ